jgi:hypothetical protein
MAGAAVIAGPGGSAVYRWTDGQGVVHFSDSPPAHAPADTRVLPLTSPPPPADAEADLFSVINQARRMAEERRARERARLEELRVRAELERAAARAPRPPEGGEDGADAVGRHYLVPLYAPFYRRFPRPDLREFPEGHPAYRPYPWRPARSTPRTGRLVPGRP